MKITYDELGRVSELHFEKDEDQKVLTDFILENILHIFKQRFITFAFRVLLQLHQKTPVV